PLGDEKSANFHFDIMRQSGNDVLKVHDLDISYDQKTPLLSSLSFHIKREDSVALIGPNGIGKSTLIKTLTDTLKPVKGEISFGSHVTIG
ncbi:hypothetical protein CGS27_31140, partial [Enterobacter cloacae]